ncbi:hypothetical protein HFP15_29325 [Amycolatopsis sp. K13G38]|uniref:HNH endonuclease n=1 Tax=Amycolatopsis acididurans TaxID=2724524 RepID=A0ABX1JFF4_9PSEU|nr:hypothetical protein [Amycolatopsis acididurans]NKQ56977.1 hypothetical protein [Amycolatopsis acididurans]
MAAALYLVLTVLAAIVAVFVPSVRRWFRGRRRPLRAVGMIALAWLVVFVALAVASARTTQQRANVAAPTPSTTTSAPAPTPSCHARSDNGQPLPDATCTPGSTNADVTPDSIADTICAPGWTDKVRPPASYTDPLKARQIVAYGYPDGQPADYEEDHLIPLELGGNPTDPQNMWPEFGNGQSPNAKDAVENALNHAVCGHQITLAAAQHAIATDWTTAETVLGLNTPATTASTPPPAPTAAPTQAPVQQNTPAPSDPLAGRYHAGEFCSKANLGVTTTATNGAMITCQRDGSYNRWKY